MPISKALRVGKFIITSEDIAPGAVTFADIGTIYSSNITENSNLFFSNARATAAIEAGLLANLNIAGNLVVDSNVLYIDSVSNRVGVGTTAPTRLFTVQTDNPSGSATLGVRNQSSGTGAYATITTEALGTTGYFYTFGSGYTSSGQYLANSSLIEINGTNGLGLSAVSANTNASIRFYTNQTERLRLDTAGNLGLGVTPSAWNLGYKVFVAGGTNSNNQVGGIASGSGITIVSTNYYRSATPSDLYAGDGFAMQYRQASGQHQWYTAPSGTAGNAITFTQAMTLDASGRLLVGTTAHTVSSSEKFEVYNGMTLLDFSSDSVASLYIKNRSTTSATIQPYIVFSDSSGNRAGMGVKTSDASFHQFGQGGFNWYGGSSGYSGQIMALSSTGNLGIGITTPATGLDVRGTSATAASTIQVVGNSISTLLLGQNADGGVIRGQGGNNCLTFWTGGSGDMAASGSGTERLRIANDGTITAKAAVRFDHAGQLSGDVFLPTVPGGTPVLYGRGGSDLVQLTGNGTTYKIVATRYTTQADYSIFYILLWRKPTGSLYNPPFMTFHGELCAHRGNELGVSRMSYVYASRGYNASNYSTVTTLHGGTIGFSSNITWNGGTYCGFYVDIRGGAGILFWDIDAVFTYNDSGSQGNVLDQFLVTFSSTTLQHS